ncbi:MAG: GNAT family N-acetyltransferase [Chitinispirillaceae bacterium]|nr:GNAT family N-acetyltransferase [Chitinispirillaceae bacterium]
MNKTLPTRRPTRPATSKTTGRFGDAKFIEGSIELLDAAKPLWKKQALLHASISPYFAEEFRRLTFADRKKELAAKAGKKKVRVILARTHGGRTVGYAVGTINAMNVGEIDSLFVLEAYRRTGIGSRLVEQMVRWIAKRRAASITVQVATGNETTCLFYRRFGFFPKVTTLVKKRR